MMLKIAGTICASALTRVERAMVIAAFVPPPPWPASRAKAIKSVVARLGTRLA